MSKLHQKKSISENLAIEFYNTYFKKSNTLSEISNLYKIANKNRLNARFNWVKKKRKNKKNKFLQKIDAQRKEFKNQREINKTIVLQKIKLNYISTKELKNFRQFKTYKI
jgi:hypothetical protein